MLGGIFVPTSRATHHGVILNVMVFIKHLLFSFLTPHGGLYKGENAFKENLFDSSGPSGEQPICGQVDG